MELDPLRALAPQGFDEMERDDAELAALLVREHRRQHDVLLLMATCSPALPSAPACQGAPIANATAEGSPRARYHAGCLVLDEVVANKNQIPGDRLTATITRGLRLGSTCLSARAMGRQESRHTLDGGLRHRVRRRVSQLCERFPLYPPVRA
jgi:glycine/serine hydroxymethyltransferase